MLTPKFPQYHPKMTLMHSHSPFYVSQAEFTQGTKIYPDILSTLSSGFCWTCHGPKYKIWIWNGKYLNWYMGFALGNSVIHECCSDLEKSSQVKSRLLRVNCTWLKIDHLMWFFIYCIMCFQDDSLSCHVISQYMYMPALVMSWVSKCPKEFGKH